MSEWGWKTIEPDLCEIVAGGTPSTANKEYWDGDILWITPADMSRCNSVHISDSERKITEKGIKYASGKLMPANSVVMSCRAPVGYCSLPDKPFTTNQGCKTLICKKVDAGYLYYYLLASTDRLLRVSSGTTFLELSKKELSCFAIYLPQDKNEQHKIAEVLIELDEVIEKTKQTLTKYRNLKVGAVEDIIKLGSNGHPDSLTSGKPDISQNWRFARLEELTAKIADRNHTTPTYVKNGGVIIVSPKDFDEDQNIDFSSCARIPLKDHLINRKRTDIEIGDLIFTRIGAGLGKVCLVTEDMPEFSILHSAAMIRTNAAINNRYLTQIIRSFYFQKQISRGIQSIGVPDLGMDKIKDLMVLYPKEIDEQKRLAEVLDKIDENILKEKLYLKKLYSVKQGLLQDLLSGKVDVTNLM